MKKKMLERLRGQWIRLRPVARRFTDSCQRLASVDDRWLVERACESGLRLSNERTGHYLDLPPDHIHEFRTDPSSPRSGFLLLQSGVTLQGRFAQVEPLLPYLNPRRRVGGGPSRVRRGHEAGRVV